MKEISSRFLFANIGIKVMLYFDMFLKWKCNDLGKNTAMCVHTDHTKQQKHWYANRYSWMIFQAGLCSKYYHIFFGQWCQSAAIFHEQIESDIAISDQLT